MEGHPHRVPRQGRSVGVRYAQLIQFGAYCITDAVQPYPGHSRLLAQPSEVVAVQLQPYRGARASPAPDRSRGIPHGPAAACQRLDGPSVTVGGQPSRGGSAPRARCGGTLPTSGPLSETRPILILTSPRTRSTASQDMPRTSDLRKPQRFRPPLHSWPGLHGSCEANVTSVLVRNGRPIDDVFEIDASGSTRQAVGSAAGNNLVLASAFDL